MPKSISRASAQAQSTPINRIAPVSFGRGLSYNRGKCLKTRLQRGNRSRYSCGFFTSIGFTQWAGGFIREDKAHGVVRVFSTRPPLTTENVGRGISQSHNGVNTMKNIPQVHSSIQNSAAVLNSANHLTPVGSIARALDAGVITLDRAGGDGMVVLSVAIYSQVKDGQRSAIQFADPHGVPYAVRGQDFTDAQARALLIGALVNEANEERRAWHGRTVIEHPKGYLFSTRVHDDYIDIEVSFDAAQCTAEWLWSEPAVFERLAFEVNSMIEYVRERPQWFAWPDAVGDEHNPRGAHE